MVLHSFPVGGPQYNGGMFIARQRPCRDAMPCVCIIRMSYPHHQIKCLASVLYACNALHIPCLHHIHPTIQMPPAAMHFRATDAVRNAYTAMHGGMFSVGRCGLIADARHFRPDAPYVMHIPQCTNVTDGRCRVICRRKALRLYMLHAI